MIIGMLIVLLFILLLRLINIALKSNSKECDFEMEVNIKGFKLTFKTNKKKAPSNHD